MIIENLKLFTGITGAGNSRIGIAYIYCDYRQQKNQTTTNIIGSVTNQLLESLTDHDLNRICEEKKLEQEMKQKQASPNFTMGMLKLVLKMFDHTFICLDALDELEMETQSSLLKSVQEILNETKNTPGSISLCFTARPHVKDMVIQILGENNSQSMTITANDDDLRKYILHELANDPHPKRMNNNLREQLLNKIPTNSRGMYVHVPTPIARYSIERSISRWSY